MRCRRGRSTRRCLFSGQQATIPGRPAGRLAAPFGRLQQDPSSGHMQTNVTIDRGGVLNASTHAWVTSEWVPLDSTGLHSLSCLTERRCIDLVAAWGTALCHVLHMKFT